MRAKLTITFLAVFLLTVPASAGNKTSRQQRIDKSLSAGTRYLLRQINEDGSVTSHTYKRYTGGMEALVVYALLAADVSPRTPELQRAINYLMGLELKHTYCVALRACAMAEWNDPQAMYILRRDVEWLMQAAGADGDYTYTSRHGASQGDYDNSNSQMAVLGIWAAARRGIKIPEDFWRRIEAHWLQEQLADGGWAYRRKQRNSYGSMTAAGLATMYVTFDALHQKDFLKIKADSDYKPISNGLEWLGEHFSATYNPSPPNHGKSWYYYWLYSIERVGLASGLKYFGTHNWYAECVDELLPRQNSDGSWGSTHETAFAVLFLARGRNPVLINKLRYRGKWNTRPRDCANLTSWLSWNFERQVSWQVIDINTEVTEWHDAPILYISGSGPWEPEEEKIDRLRSFAFQGGTIISEAAGNNATFTTDIRKLAAKMFPNMPMQRLPDDHPVYNLYFNPKGKRGLMGVTNGIRWLMIHAPGELSRDLQVGKRKDNVQTFQLLANMYMLASDKGSLRPRGTTHWPEKRQFTPAATIKIAKLKFDGNHNPEPLAWERLATIMANRYSLNLLVNGPLPIVLLDAKEFPIAVMTGTGQFTLSEAELGSLTKYFRDGGTLIIDAAAGSRKFERSVYKQILTLPEGAVEGPLASSHAIYKSPETIDKVTYRRELATVLGKARRQPRLRAVTSNGRIAIIYSREDITSGLVGYNFHGIRGYAPQSAVNLMANMLSNLSRKSAATPTPAEKPEQPAPKP